MATAKKKPKKTDKWDAVELKPYVESPTFGQVQRLATTVIDLFGGPAGAAGKLSGENYVVLCILAALQPQDKAKLDLPIFGVEKLR